MGAKDNKPTVEKNRQNKSIFETIAETSGCIVHTKGVSAHSGER